jgi:hypothetical protein
MHAPMLREPKWANEYQSPLDLPRQPSTDQCKRALHGAADFPCTSKVDFSRISESVPRITRKGHSSLVEQSGATVETAALLPRALTTHAKRAEAGQALND